MPGEFETLLNEFSTLRLCRDIGRLIELSRGTFLVGGLSRAALGDRVLIRAPQGNLGGEIIRLSPQGALVLPEEDPQGLGIGLPVELLGQSFIRPDSSWLGRILDPLGEPLDGRPLIKGRQPRSIVNSPPPAALRKGFGQRLSTGLCIFDTLLPLVQGQRLGLFAGSGVGKSTLLSKLAQKVESDIAVIALVGERGRELREFTERTLGPLGMARSIIVAASSDQSPLMRRRCAMTAMSIAEYFRDQGKNVLLMIDSITRFAEAHREIAVASGEEASLRGYPPSTSHMIMSLAERAGPGVEGSGDITGIFTVLVAGSDMEEPVSDILRGTIDGHVILDREIAERGRYPAVDFLRSVSRSLPQAATPEENALIAEVRRTLGAYDRIELLVKTGIYEKGNDAETDRAVDLFTPLDEFMASDAPEGGPEASFARLAEILAQPI